LQPEKERVRLGGWGGGGVKFISRDIYGFKIAESIEATDNTNMQKAVPNIEF